MHSKKGISAVVAMALLLLVAVVSAVAFQSWFNTYSAGLQTQIEGNSDDKLSTYIDNIIDGLLYIQNGGNKNISYQAIYIGNTLCNSTGVLTNGSNTIDLTLCSDLDIGSKEITVITDDGILNKEVYVTNSFSVTCQNFSGSGYHGGDGSSANPYQICNCTQLQDIQNNLASNYELIHDIDCSASSTWNGGLGFDSIGGTFSGTIDGKDYSIDQLTSNRSGFDQLGLIAELTGTVTNLGMTSVDLFGRNRIGGIAGYVNGGTITNSYVTGGIISEGSRNGGLAGFTQSATIRNSYAIVSVRGNTDNGGLLGYVIDTTISDSYSKGYSNGTNNVGGFIGQTLTTSSSITNSYSTGNVNGSIRVGGFIGRSDVSDIDNSFSTGGASGTSNVGGFAGIYVSGTYSNNFWNNISTNPISHTGSGSPGEITAISDNLNYFYQQNNLPLANWSTTNWDFNGALPELK